MGSFSFRRADKTTKQANFVSSEFGGDTMKILIPQEFVEHYGCKFIKSKYYDYGRIYFNSNNKKNEPILIDLYGLIAFLNRDMPMPTIYGETHEGKIKDYYRIDGKGGFEDTTYDDNRSIGIALACYAKDHRKCKYKLKICSPSYKGKYEDLLAFSMGDNAQGWSKEYWDSRLYNGMTIEEVYEKECVLTEP